VHESKAVTHERTIAKIWQVACSGGLTKDSRYCFCDWFFDHGCISIWDVQAMAQADMAREGLKKDSQGTTSYEASTQIISGNAMLCNPSFVQG
jgi:hypothetical protein